MRCYRFFLPLLFLLFPTVAGRLVAQSWDLVRDREGIRVYTRQEPGRDLKSFRGTVDMKAPAEKIFALVEDVNNTGWWDANLREIRILKYQKNRMAQYYIVYDTPWPVADRDICVDVTVMRDTLRRVYTVTAVSRPAMLPEQEGRVRMRDYRQSWRIEAAGDRMSHVILEGYADPGGFIPSWLVNLVLSDTPFNVISQVRNRVEVR